MPTILMFVHLVLCVLAIYSGATVLWELLSNCAIGRQTVFFLRCSLGSNMAALLFQLHNLLPSQRVAMIAIYCMGIIALAWRKFHLHGAWRGVFAFTISVVLYLNLLSLTMQAHVHLLIVSRFGSLFLRNFHTALPAVFLFLGAFAVIRFSHPKEECPAPARPYTK